MGLTDDEAAELAVLERELFAGSVAVSDAQIARYDVLREKKLADSADVVRPRESGAAAMGGVDPVGATPADASLTVPNDERVDHNTVATSEAVVGAAEPAAAESDGVGITQRLKDWVADVRRVPVRRRLALAGLGIVGAAAIIAGLVGYGELTKPRPVASGTFETIPANEAPDWRDEASVDEIQWSKLKWSGDFDLPVYELFQLETRGATCVLMTEDGTVRAYGCVSPGQVMSFRTREGDGESPFGEDFPVRLIVKNGKMTAWDDVPRDPEEYR